MGTIRVLYHPSVESLYVTWGDLVIGHFSLKTSAIFFHQNKQVSDFPPPPTPPHLYFVSTLTSWGHFNPDQIDV